MRKTLRRILKVKILFYYLSIELLVRFLTFISIPVFTNAWTKEEFGKFSLYISILPVASIIMDLSQRTAIKRFYLENDNKSFRFILTIYIFCFMWFSLLFSLSFLFRVKIIDPFFTKLILVNSFLLAFIEIFLAYLQISEQVVLYNLIYFSRQALPYIFVFLLFLFFGSFSSIIFPLTQMFMFFLIAVLIIYFLTKSKGEESIIFDINFLKYSLKIGLSVIPAVLSAFALNFADRYMIAYYYSTKEVAEYSIAYSVAMILSMIVLASNKAWQPFILKSLQKSEIRKIRKYARLYVLAILIIGIIVSLLSKQIILFISNTSYLGVSDIVPVITTGIFFYFLYTLYSNIAFYYKKMLLFSLPAIVAAVTNIILNFLLLPIYGYKIAAWTTLISYLFEFGIIYFIATKVLKTKLL